MVYYGIVPITVYLAALSTLIKHMLHIVLTTARQKRFQLSRKIKRGENQTENFHNLREK